MSNSDKNSEKKYKKLAKEMEMILDNIPGLVFYKDTENNLIRVNKYFADSHKLNKKEIEGKSCFDFYSKEQAQAYWDDDLKVINSGKPKLNILESWEIESGVRWLSTNKIPFIDDKGKCIGIIGFSKDVTEEIKAKAEIHKLSAYNRNLIEVSLDPLATIDQDGKIMDVNFATETIIGHSREELIGTEFSSYFTEPEKATEGYKKVFETGSVQDYELGLQHVDGHVTPVLYNASIFKDENGKVMGVFAAARDITKRKLIEKKLKDYSRNLENIVEQRTLRLQKKMEENQLYLDIAGVMLLVINADGTVIRINKKGCEILGYAEEQIVGKNWFDNFILKENREELKSVFRKIIAGEIEPVDYYENSILSKNGIEKIIAWHNNVLKDEQGNIVGTLSSGEDITERKKADKKLKEQNWFLNNIIESLTHPFFVINIKDYSISLANTAASSDGNSQKSFCYNLNHNRDKPCGDDFKCPLSEVVRTKKEVNVEHTHYNQRGETRIYDVHAYPIFDKNDEVIQMIEYSLDITEQKKMMEELRIKDIIFKTSLSAQSTADINGIIDHVNPAFLELWGYKSNEEAIGNSVGSFFENPDDAIPVLKALTETGKWEGEFLAKRNDGSRFISQGFATAIYNEQGEQIGFLSTNLDVTKHKEAEKKLEESEKKYRTLYESNLDGITHVGMEGNFIDVNKTLLDMIGYTMEDLKGKTFHELTPRKYSEVDENSVNQIMTIGYCDEYEKELIRKDGTHFPINLKGWLERDDKGEPIGLWAIIRDITEHKNAETLIQESVENFMDIVDNSPDGFIIADEKGRHLFANQKTADITGYSIEELVSMTGWDLTRPEDKKELREMMKKVLRGETHNMPYERILLRKDGSEIFTEFRTAFTKWKGKISPMAVIRDITEQKRIEKELLSTLENLKSANIELERFAYVASHDLQEPLRMIVSFIQLLEKRYKDKLDEDADEFMAFIVDGAKRMQSLISDLLIYSRIGRIVEPFRSIDINVVIDSVINNLKKSIVEIDAKITYDPLPILTGNEIELMQLLQNLISNAIKFHKDERPPVVHISAKLLKNQWIFSIRDNGIGIDSQYFDRIFIIFQRLHKKDEFGGTGIGLAICKKIIERHRGKIWVESELGKGSTFYFSIPKTEVRK